MGTTVRVGLSYGNNAVSQFYLNCDGGFCVVNDSDSDYKQIIQTINASSISINSNGSTADIYDRSGGTLLLNGLTESNIIIPLYYNEGYVLSINDKNYRGGVTYSMNSSGAMNIINVVNIDQYVYGVLPNEIGASVSLETQKAQAVAARTYALVSTEKGGNHSAYDFDVCNSTHCQVYRGYSSESTQCNQATDETSGLCIYYEGKPVTAYYAKNAGGYTQDVADVWGTEYGYLKAVPDPYSPDYEWSCDYSFAELESMLSKNGKSVGTLQSVEITALSDNGNVKELTFTGSTGNAVYKNSNIRSLFGSSNVKSNDFRFNGYITKTELDQAGNRIERVRPETEQKYAGILKIKELLMLGKDIQSEIINNNKFIVKGADTTANYSSKDEVYVINGAGEVYLANEQGKTYAGTSEEITADTISISVVEGDLICTDGSLHIVGLGYGHGVGMQQDGAIRMGSMGYSFEDILHYYYTDIEIK